MKDFLGCGFVILCACIVLFVLGLTAKVAFSIALIGWRAL